MSVVIRRIGPVLVVAAVAALSACGSSGGSPSVASAGTPSPAAASPSASLSGAQLGHLAAQCLRDHGIPAKDPVLPIAAGTSLPAIFGVNASAVSQAQLTVVQQACGAIVQQFQRVAGPPPPWGTTEASKLAFAKCMRGHGVPNWPDPVAGSNDFPLQQAGINKTDPAVQAGVRACAGQ